MICTYVIFQKKKKNPPVVPKVEKVFNKWLKFRLLRPKFSKLSRGPVGFPGWLTKLPAVGAGAPALSFWISTDLLHELNVIGMCYIKWQKIT